VTRETWEELNAYMLARYGIEANRIDYPYSGIDSVAQNETPHIVSYAAHSEQTANAGVPCAGRAKRFVQVGRPLKQPDVPERKDLTLITED
jgi:hypothetical protein